MKKQVQGIYTVCISIVLLAFVMVLVLANIISQQSAISQSGVVPVSSNDVIIEVPVLGLTVRGDVGVSECDAIYHLVSLDSSVLYAINEDWQEEDLDSLQYAVYTCIERIPTISDFI